MQRLTRQDTPFPTASTVKGNLNQLKGNGKSSKEFILFLISGGIGTALFYLLYEFLYSSLPLEHYKSSICWVVSYLCSIVWQMELHARIVFKKPINNYFAALVKTYIVYSISIVLSTAINHLFVEILSIGHQLSWVLTLGITGFINYFTVKDFALK